MKRIIFALIAVMFIAGSAYAAIPADAKYAGNCAYTLASEGKAVPTDCSVTWKDPKGTGTYCFGNADAMKKFATDTTKHTTMAEQGYAKIVTDQGMAMANDAMKQGQQAMDNAAAQMKEMQKNMPPAAGAPAGAAGSKM